MEAVASFPLWGTTARLLVTDVRRMGVARRVLDAEITAMGAAWDRSVPSRSWTAAW
jgi:hypothetical protein